MNGFNAIFTIRNAHLHSQKLSHRLLCFKLRLIFDSVRISESRYASDRDLQRMIFLQNNEGKTPLRLAVEGNHPITVKTILQEYTDKNENFMQ